MSKVATMNLWRGDGSCPVTVPASEYFWVEVGSKELALEATWRVQEWNCSASAVYSASSMTQPLYNTDEANLVCNGYIALGDASIGDFHNMSGEIVQPPAQENIWGWSLVSGNIGIIGTTYYLQMGVIWGDGSSVGDDFGTKTYNGGLSWTFDAVVGSTTYTFDITPETWWEYDGRYDPDTGAGTPF